MTSTARGAVNLRALLEARELHDLTVHHLTPEAGAVRDVALITDIEDIASVGPDTVVLLTQEVALGGWMVSSALRYAWERKACALIVPTQTHVGAVVDLAKRLGVSLFTTSRNITRLSLDIAIQIGVNRAASLSKVQSFVDRAQSARDLDAVAELLSREVGGRVEIVSSGNVTIAASRSPSSFRAAPARAKHVIRVPLDAHRHDYVVAELEKGDHEFAEQLLSAIVPTIQVLLLTEQLRSVHASLPLGTVSALVNRSEIAEIDPPSVDTPSAFGEMIAVCALVPDIETVGSTFHRLWNEHFPHVALMRFSDGWVALIPAPSTGAQEKTLTALASIVEVLIELRVAVGVSQVSDEHNSATAIRKAWLAARIAGGGEGSRMLEFSRISPQLVARLMPPHLARELLTEMFPELAAHPHRAELTRAVVAYFEANGSMSAAAAALEVHRNTMQSRIRVVQDLGVAVTDPRLVLSLHLLFSAAN